MLIIYLISISLNLLLGLWVYFHGTKKKENKLFFLFIFGIIAWLSTLFLYYFITNQKALLFIGRLNFAVVVIMVFFGLQFSYIFPKKIFTFKKWQQILLLVETISLFLITLFTPLIDKNEIIIEGLRKTIYGPLYFLFILHFVVFSGAIIAIFFKKLKRFSGIARTQILYVVWGLLLTASLGFITNIFIPLLGYQGAANFGPFCTLFLVGAFSYAIVKYRLMDIRVVIGKSAVYLLSFATVIALALGMVFLNNRLSLSLPANIAYIAILVISIVLSQPIFRFYEKIAAKYFYYTFYSSQKVITDLGKKLTEILELNKLCSLIINTLVNTMKLDKTGVLLRDSETKQYQIQKIVGFKEENGISLVKDNFLTLYLERTKKPLVYGELSLLIRDIRDEIEKKRLEKLRIDMERIEAKLCLPLFREDKIIGMIILGSKISGEPYSAQDLELLVNLSNQASIALENAKLYAQVRDLSENLQKKIEEQTKEIKKAFQVEKKAHQELKRLDKAKTQFMMATQHYLRTPLSSMRGYLDLILGGTYGKLGNKKIKQVLKRFESSSERLSKVINELLDISHFQLGKEVVSLESNIQIEPILKEIIEELKPEAEKKKIYLRFQKPKKKLPFIKADPEKLKVALFSVIDNGIKYTDKGGVTVEVKSIKDKLQIIVKDTGMGIAKGELKTLFTRTFERSEEAKKIYTTGRGIGLYIASQIIEAHHSKIWAESKGKGKGSTFYVELPVK